VEVDGRGRGGGAWGGPIREERPPVRRWASRRQ